MNVGDKAPQFSLSSDEGSQVSLKDFAGKTLVMFFYPRDNTPGCTREAQGFSAAKKAIEATGAAVVGVSRDSLKSHASFRQSCGLTIPLLSDPDLTVHRAYGAWGEKTMYGKKVEGVIRSTFLIRDNKILRAFHNVKVDGHVDAVLRALGASDEPQDPPARATPKKAAAKKSGSLATSPKPKKAASKKAASKKT